MNIFNRNKPVVSRTVEIEDQLAFRAEEYLRVMPLVYEAHRWLQMVLNKQAKVADKPEIEKLLNEMQAIIVRAEAHHELSVESRKAK